MCAGIVAGCVLLLGLAVCWDCGWVCAGIGAGCVLGLGQMASVHNCFLSAISPVDMCLVQYSCCKLLNPPPQGAKGLILSCFIVFSSQ